MHALQQFQRAFRPFQTACDMRFENAGHVGRFITTSGKAAITCPLDLVDHVANAYCRGERPQQQVSATAGAGAADMKALLFATWHMA